jgi:hypothetical protein
LDKSILPTHNFAGESISVMTSENCLSEISANEETVHQKQKSGNSTLQKLELIELISKTHPKNKQSSKYRDENGSD